MAATETLPKRPTKQARSPPASPVTHAHAHTPITQKGLLPSNASALRESGNKAMEQVRSVQFNAFLLLLTQTACRPT